MQKIRGKKKKLLVKESVKKRKKGKQVGKREKEEC